MTDSELELQEKQAHLEAILREMGIHGRSLLRRRGQRLSCGHGPRRPWGPMPGGDRVVAQHGAIGA